MQHIMKLALDKKIEAAQQQAETLRHQISDMDASVISPQGLKPINCDFDTKLLSLSAEQCAVIGTVIQPGVPECNAACRKPSGKNGFGGSKPANFRCATLVFRSHDTEHVLHLIRLYAF